MIPPQKNTLSEALTSANADNKENYDGFSGLATCRREYFIQYVQG